MKRGLVSILICCLLAAVCGCTKTDGTAAPEPSRQEEIQEETGGGSGGDESSEDEGGGQQQGQDQQEEDEGGDSGEERRPDPEATVLDPGVGQSTVTPTPSHPEMVHTVNCSEFFDNVHDYLDACGNIDYVLSQGYGTAWPALTSDGHILLYQARGSKGGNYMRVRSANGAYLQSVSLGSATKSRIAYSLNGRPSTMSATADIAAGDVFSVSGLEKCTEICFYCMGTDQNSRLEVNKLEITYKGGFIEEDFRTEPVECGPLVRVAFPYVQDFEDASFPTTEKNTYEKYGLEAGPENVHWSTWYGCFSWQHPKNVTTFGAKSPQLRVYKEDPDYEKSQYGYLKMEFFVENLSKVSFDYYMSEFWMCATVSYCEFGTSEWTGAQQIALSQYSERETVRHFTYTLDNGRSHNAKIRIEIDPATGHPGRDHYDLLLDNFTFE